MISHFRKTVLLMIFSAVFLNMNSRAYANAFEIPEDIDVLHKIGEAVKPELPRRFRVVTWNIYKGRGHDENGAAGWQKDFQILAKNADIFLLQEASMDSAVVSPAQSVSGYQWIFAGSFFFKGFLTGVMNGSAVKPSTINWQRSQGAEPVIGTPKMAVLTTYPIEGSKKKVMAISIHGLNRTNTAKFVDQVEKIFKATVSYDGPIVFAGDFNTRSSDRIQALDQLAKKYLFSKVQFSGDQRKNPLDHMFYKGLKLETSSLKEEITSSDHPPLLAEFKQP